MNIFIYIYSNFFISDSVKHFFITIYFLTQNVNQTFVDCTLRNFKVINLAMIKFAARYDSEILSPIYT